MRYPPVNATIDLLLAAAKRAALETNATHPEDIAVAMSLAIETAGAVVHEAFQKFST